MLRPDKDGLRNRAALVVVGVWTVLGLLESSKSYVSDQLRGIPRGWWAAFVGNMPWWWAWAVLTPAVFYLAAKLRLDRPAWPRALAGHLAAAVVLSLLHLTVVGVLYWHTTTAPALPYLAPVTRQLLATPLGQVEAFANGYLMVNVMTYGAIAVTWYALEFYRGMRDRERASAELEARAATLEASMHEARLSALRMELNPHFLFNSAQRDLRTGSTQGRGKSRRNARAPGRASPAYAGA